MRTTWVAIHPQPHQTRILAITPAQHRLLLARLPPCPWSRTALPSLLQALAQWQPTPLRVVLVAGGPVSGSGTSPWADFDKEPLSGLYTVVRVPALPGPDLPERGRGRGRFADLRQLLSQEVGHVR